MNAAEQAVLGSLEAAAKEAVKSLLSDLMDKEIPALIAAEEAKLPAAYAAVVTVVTAALMPQLKALVDAKIAAI